MHERFKDSESIAHTQKISRLYEYQMKIKGGMQQRLRNKINPGSRIRMSFYLHLKPLISSAFLGLALFVVLVHIVESMVITCSCSIFWRHPPQNFSWLQCNIFREKTNLPSLSEVFVIGYTVCYQIKAFIL